MANLLAESIAAVRQFCDSNAKAVWCRSVKTPQEEIVSAAMERMMIQMRIDAEAEFLAKIERLVQAAERHAQASMLIAVAAEKSHAASERASIALAKLSEDKLHERMYQNQSR